MLQHNDSRKKVVVDRVVRRSVIRVDGTFAVVIGNDEIVMDVTICWHNASAAVAESRYVRYSVPTVPGGESQISCDSSHSQISCENQAITCSMAHDLCSHVPYLARDSTIIPGHTEYNVTSMRL